MSQKRESISDPNIKKSDAMKRQSIGMSFGDSDGEEEQEYEESEESEEGLGCFETCVEFDLDEVMHYTHDEDKPDRP
jgi:hypothetical protein